MVGEQIIGGQMRGKMADEGSGNMRWEGMANVDREWLWTLHFSVLGRVPLLVLYI